MMTPFHHRTGNRRKAATIRMRPQKEVKTNGNNTAALGS